MPKLFFYTTASVLLLFGFSEARKCTGEKIVLKSGWTLTEDKMYCAPESNSKSAQQDKSAPDAFLANMEKNLCLSSENKKDLEKEFHDSSYNLNITVKGHCRNGKKHGNFDFFTSNKKLFTVKYNENIAVKTDCKVIGNNNSYTTSEHFRHYECFRLYIKNYIEQ